MNKLFVFATLLFGMIASVFAQAPSSKGTPEERAKKLGEVWQKKLGLSEEEKAKFVVAKKGQIEKIKALRTAKPVDKAAIETAF
jgi:hypothetical protein